MKSEPVAWLYRHKTEPWKQACVVQRMDSTIAGADEWHELPLYAAPPQRQPLDLATITRLSYFIDEDRPATNAELVSFARAIERAHGIT